MSVFSATYSYINSIPHFFATIDALALIFLLASLIITFRLKKLMGEGKDTGPVKLLLVVIGVNIILALNLLYALYAKYLHVYLNYVRLSDITLLAIGIILAVATYKIYQDYKKIIKKHEPGE